MVKAETHFEVDNVSGDSKLIQENTVPDCSWGARTESQEKASCAGLPQKKGTTPGEGNVSSVEHEEKQDSKNGLTAVKSSHLSGRRCRSAEQVFRLQSNRHGG